VKPTEIKVAYIGGGSRFWARDLLGDLAQSQRLTGRVELYDIDRPAAEKNAAIGAAIFDRPEARTRFSVHAVKRLSDALRGADYVVLSIEPGPTEMRYADLEIPAQHGILQPVGDTTGPGGIARTLRAVPLYIEFARQIAEHCPQAWVINYTNPMTLCTAALHAAAPGIKAFGCCHEVYQTQHRLADLVARWFGVQRPPREQIKVELSGINHFTWVTAASWQGRDLLPRLRAFVAEPRFFKSHARAARANKFAERWFESSGQVAFDLLRRFGALGAAGDRHLVEFVSWYAVNEAQLHRWGVILTPYAWRRRRMYEVDRDVAYYAQTQLRPSGEEGVKLIEALAGNARLKTNMNLPNRGQAPDLLPGHIVETNAEFRRDSVEPLVTRPLPAGAAALVRRVIDVQQLTLRAALERDPDLAFQALLLDPLVHLPVDEAWTMFKGMLHHMKPCLPGWRLPPGR
jgi:alpha-galactosidase/6-phospho-beta-glucosidase family protein